MSYIDLQMPGQSPSSPVDQKPLLVHPLWNSPDQLLLLSPIKQTWHSRMLPKDSPPSLPPSFPILSLLFRRQLTDYAPNLLARPSRTKRLRFANHHDRRHGMMA